MKNDFKGREKFLREIGQFTVSFSKLEFALLELCAMTSESFPKTNAPPFIEYIGMSLDEKRKVIKNYIKLNLPELLLEWEDINKEIGLLNLERRHLVHGVGQAYLFHENISTYIKLGGIIQKKDYSILEIKSLTNRIGHVRTGANGIGGVFYIKFKTGVIDCYNEKVDPSERRKLIVDGIVTTKWKG